MADQQKEHRDHTHSQDVGKSAQGTQDPGHTPGKAEGDAGMDDPGVEKARGARKDDQSNDPGRTPGKAEG